MTAWRTIQGSLMLLVGATRLTIGLVLPTRFGLAAVVVPAGRGILAIELARAKRRLLNWAGFLSRRNHRLSNPSLSAPAIGWSGP